ncbi:hypothetical protein RZN32_28630, partial [Klebsiella pneumoniae]|nr:hypothetical protein [Klebsiella pneumoniae]
AFPPPPSPRPFFTSFFFFRRFRFFPSLLFFSFSFFFFFPSLFSLFSSFDISLAIFLLWYYSVTVGFITCRSSIRLGAGLLRKFGYNTRRVAVVGSTPAGISLLKGFLDEPWLGFIVLGIYDDHNSNDYQGITYAGNVSQLVQDAREGKIDRIYIALGMKYENLI